MGFTQNELQDSAFSFFKEANSVLGVDVPALVQKNGIELQYVGEPGAPTGSTHPLHTISTFA